jgi:hypothetical protein
VPRGRPSGTVTLKFTEVPDLYSQGIQLAQSLGLPVANIKTKMPTDTDRDLTKEPAVRDSLKRRTAFTHGRNQHCKMVPNSIAASGLSIVCYQRISILEDPRALTMSMLYMHDQDFQRKSIALSHSDLQIRLESLSIDRIRGKRDLRTHWRSSNKYQEYFSNFGAAFGNTYAAEIQMRTNNGTLHELKYPFSGTTLVRLRSHVRAYVENVPQTERIEQLLRQAAIHISLDCHIAADTNGLGLGVGSAMWLSIAGPAFSLAVSSVHIE